MNRVAVVTSAGTGSLDAANALDATVKANWPDADVKILLSCRVESAPRHWDVTGADEVHGTTFNLADPL